MTYKLFSKKRVEKDLINVEKGEYCIFGINKKELDLIKRELKDKKLYTQLSYRSIQDIPTLIVSKEK